MVATAKKTKNVTDKPKKPKTGYLLFCDEVRPDVKAELMSTMQEGEKLKGSEVVKGCAAKWKELSDESKATWNDMAKLEKSEAEE